MPVAKCEWTVKTYSYLDANIQQWIGLRVDIGHRKSTLWSDFFFFFLFWPTVWVWTGLSASDTKDTMDTGWRRDNKYQVEMRWWSKVFFFTPFSLWPSNPQSASRDPLTAAITIHWKCPSSENGSMQKSIKGFNVVGLPWLPRLLSVIHHVTLFHSLPLVSARPKTGRVHYV